jgi:hypothetical protein
MSLIFSRSDYTKLFKGVKKFQDRDYEAFLLIDKDKYFVPMLLKYAKLLESDGRHNEAQELKIRIGYVRIKQLANPPQDPTF